MKLKMLHESENKGTYICAKVSTDCERKLRQYCIDNNIPEPVEMGSFHCTLMYSENGTFVHDAPVINTYENPISLKVLGMDKFGDEKNCVVLELDHDGELTDRFNTLSEHADMEHSFDDFRPHVTLTYNGTEIDLDELSQFEFDIEFYGEELSPLD